MIDLAVLRGSSYIVLGSHVRARDSTRPGGGWRRLCGGGTIRQRRARRPPRRGSGWPSPIGSTGPRSRRWSSARHPEPPAQAPCPGSRGAGRRQADHLRYRTARPGRAAGALRRHHRHQRQVDHHGRWSGTCWRAPAGRSRLAATSAQCARSRSARPGWRLRTRDVVLSA